MSTTRFFGTPRKVISPKIWAQEGKKNFDCLKETPPVFWNTTYFINSSLHKFVTVGEIIAFKVFLITYNVPDFYIHGSVHRDSVLIRSNKMQQYAGIYLLHVHSTRFGRPSRPHQEYKNL